MFVLWRKLKTLQPIMPGLCRKVRQGAMTIQTSREKMVQTQQLLSTNRFNQDYILDLKHWTKELMRATALEEIIF